MTKIKAILAVSKNGAIGKDNKLPWPRFDYDFQYFKEKTTNHVIVMGYNTWLSIGRKLPNRKNVVLTSKKLDNVETISDLSFLTLYRLAELEQDVWLIGGKRIIEEALKNDLIDEFHLTEFKDEYDGDVFVDLSLLNNKKWFKTLVYEHKIANIYVYSKKK